MLLLNKTNEKSPFILAACSGLGKLVFQWWHAFKPVVAMNPDAKSLWTAPQWAFSILLALLGMLCSLASTRLRWISAAVAGTAAVAAFALPLKLNILTAIAASVLVCLLLEKTASHGPATPQGGGH